MATTFVLLPFVLVQYGGKQLSLLPNAPAKKRGRPSGSRNRTKVARKLKYDDPHPTPSSCPSAAAPAHDASRKKNTSAAAAAANNRKRNQLTCEDWQHAIYFVLLALGRIHDFPFKDLKK